MNNNNGQYILTVFINIIVHKYVLSVHSALNTGTT